MEWPFPIATSPPSLVSDSDKNVSCIEAYASMDRLFANDLELDDYLKSVLADLKKGKERNDRAFISAKHVFVRAFRNRAAFALEMKLMLRRKLLFAIKNDEPSEDMWSDVEEVEREIEITYQVLNLFKKILSPRLNNVVDDLKCAKDDLKFPVEEFKISHFTMDDEDSTTDDEL